MVAEKRLLDDGVNMKVNDNAFLVELWGLGGDKFIISF